MRAPPDHGIRDRVIGVISNQPGIHMREIARQLDVHINLADYHLRILEKAGKVISVEKGGRKGFFSSTLEPGKVPLGPVERRILLLLREVRTLAIILFLLVTGGARSGEVATEVKISPSTSTHHLKRLENEGILEKDKSRRYIISEPEKVARIIIDHRPGEDNIVDSFESLWEELSGNI